MSNYKIIGGEFEIVNPHNVEISPPLKNTKSYSVYTYSSGRSALYNICKSKKIQGKRILIPDYLCSSIPLTILKAGIGYEYYRLENTLEPNLADCVSKASANTAILLINYFGCINTEALINKIRKELPNAVVILDNVQCPFDILKKSEADYVFTSFRKAYPVTDGAFVITKDTTLSQPYQRSKFAQYKLAASLLKENREKDYYGDDIYLSLFHQGELLIDEDLDKDMSEHAKRVLQELEIHRLKILRQRNAAFVLEGLDSMGLEPLLPIAEGMTPLFVPISIDNRDTIRKKMFEKNIFCPIHWPIEIDEQQQITGLELSKSELSLIVDHRYTISDMKLILDTIKENI